MQGLNLHYYMTSYELEDKIRQKAQEFYEFRQRYGVAGTPEGDWAVAELKVGRIYDTRGTENHSTKEAG